MMTILWLSCEAHKSSDKSYQCKKTTWLFTDSDSSILSHTVYIDSANFFRYKFSANDESLKKFSRYKNGKLKRQLLFRDNKIFLDVYWLYDYNSNLKQVSLINHLSKEVYDIKVENKYSDNRLVRQIYSEPFDNVSQVDYQYQGDLITTIKTLDGNKNEKIIYFNSKGKIDSIKWRGITEIYQYNDKGNLVCKINSLVKEKFKYQGNKLIEKSTFRLNSVDSQEILTERHLYYYNQKDSLVKELIILNQMNDTIELFSIFNRMQK